MVRYRLLAALFLGVSLVALGCSRGNVHAPAKVSGRLTYKGQPIKAGKMQLHAEDGTVFEAQISPDGTYSATDVATGELIVTVDTEHLNPGKKAPKVSSPDAEKRMKYSNMRMTQGAGNADDPAEHYTKIPEKYSNPKTSPVTLELSAGRQVKDIDLTD